MRDDNEIPITNNTPEYTQRYTNEDIPYNERTNPLETQTYQEFSDESRLSDAASPSSVRFSDFDITKVASTFVVVSLVAMAVVLDDSPFGEFFEPVMDAISETFGVSGIDKYPISCEIILEPTDTEIQYYVSFDQVPDGDMLLTVKEGSSTITSVALDSTLAGTIVNLTPGTTYVFTVTVDGKVSGSPQSVSTLGTYDGHPIVKLLSAKNCNKTDRNATDDGGYFQFQIGVIDRNGVCSGFEAYLSFTPPTATVGPPNPGYVAITDVNAVQKILVPDSWYEGYEITEPLTAELKIVWQVNGETDSIIQTVYV